MTGNSYLLGHSSIGQKSGHRLTGSLSHPTKLKTRCSLVYAPFWRLRGTCLLQTYLGCGLNSVPGSCSAEVAIFLLAHNQETLSALRGHLLSLSDESQWELLLSHFESLILGRGQSLLRAQMIVRLIPNTLPFLKSITLCIIT